MSLSPADTKSTQWVDPRLELKNKPTAVSVAIGIVGTIDDAYILSWAPRCVSSHVSDRLFMVQRRMCQHHMMPIACHMMLISHYALYHMMLTSQ